MSRAHIMVDTETLAQVPNAALVSIGACKFDIKTGEVSDKFYINVDPADCKKHGLVIQKETIDWWQKQPKEAMQAWMKDSRPLEEAMTSFTDWIGDTGHIWWANGASFDYPILENAWRAVGAEPRWKYYRLNDYRTVLNIFGLRNDKIRESSTDSVYHNALDDAIGQMKTLCEVLGGQYGE